MNPAVIELRQYTLHPGRRDDLIALFEREFLDTQEAEGIRLIGQFHDLDAPDRFVWLRGFPDMAARKGSLERFYGGAVWARHRNAANETMIDSDDVLLLKPLTPASGFAEGERGRPDASEAILVAGVHAMTMPDDSAGLDADIRRALEAAGLRSVAVLATEAAENDFPRLPVRTDGPFVVWFATAPDRLQADAALERLDLTDRVGQRVQTLHLGSTVRSRLRP